LLDLATVRSLRERQAELRSAVLPFDDLEVAFVDARTRGLLRDRDLKEALERNAGRRGAKRFQRLVELDRGSGLTRSEAERKLLALVHAAALPRPKANARIARLEVDFLWPEQKVVVEVDGYAFHAGARAFERDRERDATLAARGYVVLRVTWRQLVARREALIARLAAALSLRS
jgi:very-short-patch-repair endonuclease